MKSKVLIFAEIVLFIGLTVGLNGCAGTQAKGDTSDTGPRPASVEPDVNPENFKVDHPERFPLATADLRTAAPELNVTGVVSPDITRQVPVPSLVTGRVVEIHAKVGDVVKKGQVLFKVQSSDVASALSDYRKAIRNQELAEQNENLAATQLERSKLLYDKGAAPKSALEIAINTEQGAKTNVENARVDVATTTERLRLLQTDVNNVTGIVDVTAPISGVVGDEQSTAGAGLQALATNPFTIWDTSHVWILCDVYENDIAKVNVGQYADIRLNAYPDRVLKARISNIAPMLDPNLRTAKVRLELDNPGVLRFGMFVTAIFHGQDVQKRAVVPATAVLHLHDRQWVYTPAQEGTFKRVEVVGGNMLPGNMQEIVSGIKPGEQVVANALVLQDTVEK
jgi:cobalt-zinc-cadmium efflux system membrane fusion protein